MVWLRGARADVMQRRGWQRGVVGSSGVLGGFGGLEAGAATVVERGDGIQRRAGGGRGL